MPVILSAFKPPPRVPLYPDQIYTISWIYLVTYCPSKFCSFVRRVSSLALASPALLLPITWWCYRRSRRGQSLSGWGACFLEIINEKDNLEIYLGQSYRSAERQQYLTKHFTHNPALHTNSIIFSISSSTKE